MATGASADGGDLSAAAQRIMEAADELFFRQGALATTVREITSACGLTPGALYNHFRSKDELLFRLVMRRHLLVAAALDDALAATPSDPVARLETVVRVYVRIHFGSAAHRGARVANREYRGLSAGRLAQVVAVRRSLRDRLVAILDEGSTRGVFSPCGGGDRASLVVTASTILDMFVHAAEWVRAEGVLSLAQLEDRYLAMAMRLAGATR